MDSLTTSIDFDQSFHTNWKAELTNQNSLLDLDESTNLNLSQSLRVDPNAPEITTHYIKQYKDQLEALQKDNFSLKLQIFYFQRAFENAGLAEPPEYNEGFSELEKEFTDNKKLLADANLAVNQLTEQNKDLQKKLSKFERRSSDSRNKSEDLSILLKQKENDFNLLNENFIEISHQNEQLEQKCESAVNHIQGLESEIAFLNAKSVEETENNLGGAQKLAEAEENARFYQEKNAQVLEFAKPLAQKLQETQEHLEVSDNRCEQLRSELKKGENTQNSLTEKCSALEKEVLGLKEKNDHLKRQKDELSSYNQDLQQENVGISNENLLTNSKINDYEQILDSLHQRINENARLLAVQEEEIAVKTRELKAKSHLDESLIQAKSIISQLENQLQEQNNELMMKEGSSNEELNVMRQKFLQTASKLQENECNFARLKAKNAALEKELDDFELVKQQNLVLIEEINSFRSVKKREFSSQTKLTFNELIQNEQEISELKQKIQDLVLENTNLINRHEELHSSHSELRNLTHQNEELTENLTQLKSDLELSNLRIMELEEQLKLVGTLSKPEINREKAPLTVDSENIQSILTELVDQLSETRHSLEISLTNETQLKTKLQELEDKYSMISNENGRIRNQLQASEGRNWEISQELERKKATFGNKMESANQHLKQLQHVFLPSPNSTKSELPPANTSMMGIEELDENNSVGDIVKQPEISHHENTDIDVTLPDNDLFRLAVTSDSKNISLLLSIYKELLTTHKYLSRAKQYTLPTQQP